MTNLIHIAIELKEQGEMDRLRIRILQQYAISIFYLAQNIFPEILRYHCAFKVTVVTAVCRCYIILDTVRPEDRLVSLRFKGKIHGTGPCDRRFICCCTVLRNRSDGVVYIFEVVLDLISFTCHS